MFTIVLITHIVTALAMAVLAVHSVILIYKKQLTSLPANAKNLSLLLFVQILSGSGLGLLSPVFSPQHFCTNIIFYLSAYLFVELMILFTLKQREYTQFPYHYALGSLGTSMIFPLLVLLVRMPLF